MTATQIEAWLVRAIAKSLRIDEKQVDPARPFAELGIDSVAAVELSGDLEDWLGTHVAPTVVWDYPTITLLASHLSG
ncbi:MAG: acyl carrier protein [Myxococcota bacterium]|nr:acyl carrier protein [Deltaproteobacteria bacterium]MDQ3336138.1 acyl carrier protein [Myxococcota bacterium]